MTDDEAIKIARAVAVAKGWPWKEPIRLVRLREGILGFGRPVVGRRILEIRSNADSDSRIVVVSINDRDGAVIRSSFLAPDPQKLARDSFRLLHPDRRIVWTILTAEESDRFVVGVFYGDMRPPRYMFFAIDKSTDEATPVADDTPYRPKVWR